MANRILAGAAAALIGAGCGVSHLGDPAYNGKVKFSGGAVAQLASATGGAPLVCGTFTLQPVSIDAAGDATPAGNPIVLTSSANSQTDSILGCIDDGRTGSPNWGYEVQATGWFDCTNPSTSIAAMPVSVFEISTMTCTQGVDTPLNVTVNVSIPVADSAGYIDISAGVSSSEVQVGCKQADYPNGATSGQLHFGESNIDPNGNILHGLVGIDNVSSGVVVSQWAGSVNAGAAPALDTYYTGMIDPAASSPATTLIYQTFVPTCQDGQQFAGTNQAQCITNIGSSLNTTASLAGALIESADGFASASVTDPATLQIYSAGAPVVLMDATPPGQVGFNAGTSLYTVSLAAGQGSFTGLTPDLTMLNQFIVTGLDPNQVPSYASLSYSNTPAPGAWTLGPWAAISTLNSAALTAMLSPANGCFTPNSCGNACVEDGSCSCAQDTCGSWPGGCCQWAPSSPVPGAAFSANVAANVQTIGLGQAQLIVQGSKNTGYSAAVLQPGQVPTFAGGRGDLYTKTPLAITPLVTDPATQQDNRQQQTQILSGVMSTLDAQAVAPVGDQVQNQSGIGGNGPTAQLFVSDGQAVAQVVGVATAGGVLAQAFTDGTNTNGAAVATCADHNQAQAQAQRQQQQQQQALTGSLNSVQVESDCDGTAEASAYASGTQQNQAQAGAQSSGTANPSNPSVYQSQSQGQGLSFDGAQAEGQVQNSAQPTNQLQAQVSAVIPSENEFGGRSVGHGAQQQQVDSNSATIQEQLQSNTTPYGQFGTPGQFDQPTWAATGAGSSIDVGSPCDSSKAATFSFGEATTPVHVTIEYSLSFSGGDVFTNNQLPAFALSTSSGALYFDANESLAGIVGSNTGRTVTDINTDPGNLPHTLNAETDFLFGSFISATSSTPDVFTGFDNTATFTFDGVLCGGAYTLALGQQGNNSAAKSFLVSGADPQLTVNVEADPAASGAPCLTLPAP